MPKSTFRVPNPLGKEKARQLLEQFLPHVQERFQDMIKDVTQSWSGDTLDFSFRTMGMNVKGTILVETSELVVNLEVPFALAMVKGRIEKEFTDGLTKLLTPPANG